MGFFIGFSMGFFYKGKAAFLQHYDNQVKAKQRDTAEDLLFYVRVPY